MLTKGETLGEVGEDDLKKVFDWCMGNQTSKIATLYMNIILSATNIMDEESEIHKEILDTHKDSSGNVYESILNELFLCRDVVARSILMVVD